MVEIKVVEKVLAVNDQVAGETRRFLKEQGIFMLNVMSSPGSGKTTLLEKTLAALKDRLRVAVVVGDICTTRDADRLSLGGTVPAVQICTEPFGGDCHLAAHVVREAMSGLDLDHLDLLIVENVGNLVCPAEFDIGEDQRAVVLSVAEGEDKPLKYPLMFRVCNVAVLNKIDLLPHLDYDRNQALDNIKAIHNAMPIFQLSAKTEEGLEQWINWLSAEVSKKKKGMKNGSSKEATHTHPSRASGSNDTHKGHSHH